MADPPPAKPETSEGLARGEALGRYLVLDRLGAGAVGVVHAAYDPELDRKVAIKLLRRQAGDDVESRRQARLVREAKAIAKLAHANVVSIFDVGVADGRVFLAMEYLSGGTLRAWMAAKKRPWRETVRMFIEVGKGLAAAHAEGLVHRDFKPDNVLLDKAGTPKVVDFGLVRRSGPRGTSEHGVLGEGDHEDDVPTTAPGDRSGGTPRAARGLTRSGTFAGSPAYMASEQFFAKETDGRTDQFAFCVALHEALYGQRPFDESSVFELADSVMHERLQPPPKNVAVPSFIRRSLLRGLRADRAQRWDKLEDLLAALQRDPVVRFRRILVGTVVAVVFVGTLAGLYRRSERRRLEFEGRVSSKLNGGRQALDAAGAISHQMVVARGRAFDAFDRARREEGEASWTEARLEAAQLESTLRRAQSELEAALSLDPANPKAREALEEALFQRAELAELEFRRADLNHLVEQMERLDTGGRLMARWTRPGTVDLRTTPSGARLVVERYDSAGDDATGRLVPVRVGEAFLGSSGPRALPPGSYRVTATKVGALETRLPFVVHRGESLTLDLPLLAPTELPADFVYVPAGRFLYGDADEDWRLAFLNATPIHERTTPAFLIKAHETTFGEWLAYLRELPAAERRARTPSSAAIQGSVAITGSSDADWSLELNISGRRVATHGKGLLTYATRKVRASQDWLRMPVIGVSQRDMAAYLEWLARSGRVPGARFCTEVEWERAARGADERSYPGSQSRITGDDADIDLTYGRVAGSYGPDEVGSHGLSDSPFGVADMTGNVWEIVEACDESAGFLMRGGSYYQAATSGRTTNREPIDLETRSYIVGLRVCAARN